MPPLETREHPARRDPASTRYADQERAIRAACAHDQAHARAVDNVLGLDASGRGPVTRITALTNDRLVRFETTDLVIIESGLTDRETESTSRALTK